MINLSKDISVLLILLIISLISCNKTESESEKVTFLNFNPKIDGFLDPDLQQLKTRPFKYIWQLDNPVTHTVGVSYRMAYTPTHLYLYIETINDSLNYRPRGFVNGGGFKFLISNQKKDSLSVEFNDMVFSASKNKKYWVRKRIWDHNHNQNTNQRFSEKTLFEEKNNVKVNGFEA